MASPPHPDPTPDLETLVSLAEVLRQDEEIPRSDRRQRDRAIGRDLAELAGQPARQLTAWLLHPGSPAAGDAGRTVSRVHRLATLLLAVLGLVTGVAAAAAVFHYDGENPVNVIHVLAVFVFAQLLLVLLTIVTMLPPAALRYVPGARSLQETLSLFSPGRIRSALFRRLPQAVRDTFDGAVGRGMAHRSLFSGVDKWAISFSAQWGALCFQVGALAGCLYLVVFSDLAFSWNTTLQVEPAGLHRLTSALATPWSAWLADAEPSLDLIESTRHFRLKDGMFPGMESGPSAGPSALGGWWPFLVACMTTYGLLPRLITLVVAGLRLRAAIRQTLLHLPGAGDLLDRLNGELVETAAAASPSGPAAPESGPVPASTPAGWPNEDVFQVVNWANTDVSGEQLGQWLQGTAHTVLEAGGARSLEEDRAVMDRLGEGPDRAAVAILVRAWEPPMTEFLDFVSHLRATLGTDRRIVVLAVGVAGDHHPLPRELAMWQRRLDTLGDPWLRVLPAGGGA